jgi:hypothetical protein
VISLWWEILKNAKVSGKATGKGSSFNASKIKINLDKNDCKERLRKLIWFNATEPAPDSIAQIVGRAPGKDSYLINTPEFNKLPEKTACNILQTMKSINLNNIEGIELVTSVQRGVRYKDIDVGEGYKLFLEIDEEYYESIGVIRYYISDGEEDTAWIMFPFSDIEKWMAAL